MKKKRSIFVKALGIVLIVIGLVGFVLPIIPGFIFVILGMSLLGVDFVKEIKALKKKASRR